MKNNALKYFLFETRAQIVFVVTTEIERKIVAAKSFKKGFPFASLMRI